MARLRLRFLSRFMPRQTGLLIAVLTALVILVLIGAALAGLNDDNDTQQMQIAAQAIDRAARQCYALEGAYPPDLAYLESHYGLLLDREHYHYFYEVIGANIHPIVEVQVK